MLADPPLQPTPVSRPFQILGVEVMDLPRTERGNKHVIVFQDILIKWPIVVPILDQKTSRVLQILVEEVIPIFGIPEALLRDRGTNLLSHLMQDVCRLLGIEKHNTTAYHPQCNGPTERFNRTHENIWPSSAASGIAISTVSSGHIKTRLMSLPAKNLRSSSLGLIAGARLMLPCYQWKS